MNVGLYTVNNISLSTPTSPTSASWLELFLSGKAIKNRDLGPNIIRVKEGDVIQLVFNNGKDGTHPMHLHGHWMW